MTRQSIVLMGFLTCAATASVPALTPDHQLAVHCSTVFALVAADQARNAPGVRAYPPLAARGREFFARTGAQVMDDTGADRVQVQALFAREAASVRQEVATASDKNAALDRVLRPCLGLLDLTIPATVGRNQ